MQAVHASYQSDRKDHVHAHISETGYITGVYVLCVCVCVRACTHRGTFTSSAMVLKPPFPPAHLLVTILLFPSPLLRCTLHSAHSSLPSTAAFPPATLLPHLRLCVEFATLQQLLHHTNIPHMRGVGSECQPVRKCRKQRQARHALTLEAGGYRQAHEGAHAPHGMPVLLSVAQQTRVCVFGTRISSRRLSVTLKILPYAHADVGGRGSVMLYGRPLDTHPCTHTQTPIQPPCQHECLHTLL